MLYIMRWCTSGDREEQHTFNHISQGSSLAASSPHFTVSKSLRCRTFLIMP